MKSNEKKMILVLLIILAIVVGIKIITSKKASNNIENNDTNQIPKTNVVYFEYLEDGTKLNISKALAKERKLGDLNITNITLSNKNGKTTLLADVENTGNTTSEQKLVAVTIIDKDGNILITLKGLIISLKPGQKTQLNVGVMSDFSNAYDFKIEEINK